MGKNGKSKGNEGVRTTVPLREAESGEKQRGEQERRRTGKTLRALCQPEGVNHAEKRIECEG